MTNHSAACFEQGLWEDYHEQHHRRLKTSHYFWSQHSIKKRHSISKLLLLLSSARNDAPGQGKRHLLFLWTLLALLITDSTENCSQICGLLVPEAISLICFVTLCKKFPFLQAVDSISPSSLSLKTTIQILWLFVYQRSSATRIIAICSWLMIAIFVLVMNDRIYMYLQGIWILLVTIFDKCDRIFSHLKITKIITLLSLEKTHHICSRKKRLWWYLAPQILNVDKGI